VTEKEEDKEEEEKQTQRVARDEMIEWLILPL
jgi:hypothetical protein